MSESEIRAIVREELALLGDSGLPGGANAIPGLDPYYRTHPLRQPHTLPVDAATTDGESEFPIGAGETKQFRYVMNNKTPDGVYGVAINTPPGILTNSAAIILQVINGTTRARALTNDGDFNRSVGRFNTGTIIVEGQIENGPTPGLVKIAYGTAEAESDLNLTGHGDQDAIKFTGTDTITLGKAGRYIVTFDVTLDCNPDPILVGPPLSPPPYETATISGTSIVETHEESYLVPWQGSD